MQISSNYFRELDIRSAQDTAAAKRSQVILFFLFL